MKKSYYNFLYSASDSKYILYNSLSQSLIELDRNNYDMFIGLPEKGIVKDEQLVPLIDNGFIVDEDINELDVIKYFSKIQTYANHTLELVIAPTLNCNFGCPYCFETRKPQVMNKKVQDEIINFAKDFYDAGYSLHVTWYGGEPLLNFEIIEFISESLINIFGDKYNAGMITNGYLLEEEVVSKFKKLKIESVQITIDGTKSVHDERRFLLNHKGTYDKIICNVKNSLKYKSTIFHIRINIDKNNIHMVDEILDDFKHQGLEGDNIIPYLALIEEANDNTDKIENQCIPTVDFFKDEVTFNKKAVEKKFINALNVFPEVKLGYCGMSNINNYVIDPKGYFYRCWEDIGIEKRSIGNILKNNEAYQTKNLLEIDKRNPFKFDKCNNCKMLPICFGGCPSFGHGEYPNCIFNEESLKYKILESYYSAVTE